MSVRASRLLAFSTLLGAAAVLATALAVVPDAAAFAADGARAVVGDRAIADLEDLVYGARDRVARMRHEGERPEARWVVPERADLATEAEPPPTAGSTPPWSPVDVGPMFTDFAADGDGVWVEVAGDGERPLLKKTLLHPDRTRAFAELFVVAVDLSATTLHYAAGADEPESIAPSAEDYVRRSDVPEAQRDGLLAAFDGGFKTRHGRHGVEVGGLTLVPLRAGLCTLVGAVDGSLTLGSLPNGRRFDGAAFVRQTPRCLVENGERHPGLVQELTASWGAAVGGDTVIRRSAIGLSADGGTLFVGVSNRTTATALADGMRHAGASVAAQLDVNEAFPRFLTYRARDRGTLVAESIAPGFHYRKDHYLGAPSSRDFFYLTRKAVPLVARAGRSARQG